MEGFQLGCLRSFVATPWTEHLERGGSFCLLELGEEQFPKEGRGPGRQYQAGICTRNRAGLFILVLCATFCMFWRICGSLGRVFIAFVIFSVRSGT